MKKNQFIEIVKGILTGGDPNPDLQEKYHESRIELVASMAFSNALYEVFRLQLDEKDLYTKDFVLDVQYDEQFEEYYSILPTAIMQLPDNSGIHEISPIKGGRSFEPTNRLSNNVFQDLEVGKIDQIPTYYPTSGRKIVYQYYDWKNKHIKKVRAAVVLGLEFYDSTDDLIIPAGKEDVIMQFVTQTLSNQLPTDDSPNLDDKQV